ncbi:ubiquitin-specific peptidase 7 (C19 family) [Aphelenchoides avenae]|nr:ubiquitin-specific peptidase 7 (C19 family) [Aphelenchus avenae]
MAVTIQLRCSKADEEENEGWRVTADVTLRIVAQQPLKRNATRVLYGVAFTSSRNGWGFRRFLQYEEILKAKLGFLSDDASLVVEAHVFPK